MGGGGGGVSGFWDPAKVRTINLPVSTVGTRKKVVPRKNRKGKGC